MENLHEEIRLLKERAERAETARETVLAAADRLVEVIQKAEHDPYENRHCSCLQFELIPAIMAYRAACSPKDL